MEVNGDLTEELYNHGMSLNPRNDRVQCNYCGLVVAGFDFLRLHLGGKTSVCPNAPSEVKELFQTGLNILEEQNPYSTPNSKGSNRKRGNSRSPRSEGPKRVSKIDSCQSMISRWICRFLIENSIDFDAAESYSFRKMLEVASRASDITSHIPSIKDLKDSLFSDELEETRIRVDSIRESWSKTGCSIVLDAWTDDINRNVMIVVVDCPLGAIYIDSFDISSLAEDIEGFQLLLEGVLEDVGIQNVVQIISHTSSDFMNDVGKNLVEKHKSLFWSVSASHCVSLMLDKISKLNTVEQVFDMAKRITKFIYSEEDALKLMRSYIHSFDLIKSCKFKTLENILMKKEDLKKMVDSSEWKNSSWASNVKGKRVSDMILDKSFWEIITVVVRATMPLVNALKLINGDGVGFIYETLDQVKETISKELQMEKIYKPYWKIIDEIWDDTLHIPLHAAGYYLNPRFQYTDEFSADAEVIAGLLTTIVRMVEDKSSQDVILTKMLKVYEDREGAFRKGSENKKHNSIPPAAWWLSYGSHCPDLQKFAVRVLSQRCNGAESYGLKKGLAEKVEFKAGRNDAERLQLRNMAYVHYNMKLKQRGLGAKCDGEEGEIDYDCDWIVEEEGL